VSLDVGLGGQSDRNALIFKGQAVKELPLQRRNNSPNDKASHLKISKPSATTAVRTSNLVVMALIKENNQSRVQPLNQQTSLTEITECFQWHVRHNYRKQESFLKLLACVIQYP
jgi:hypothetical protein